MMQTVWVFRGEFAYEGTLEILSVQSKAGNTIRIENIFTVFRVDFVAGYEAGRNVRTGIVIGMRVDD